MDQEPRGGNGGAHAEPHRGARHKPGDSQNSSLRAFAGKALTMGLAGFAFTRTTLPKISRFPAFVAFFWRVLIITTPGITNLPFFFASVVAMLASVLKAVLITPRFTSQLSASTAVRALLVMTVDFIIGAICCLGEEAAAQPMPSDLCALGHDRGFHHRRHLLFGRGSCGAADAFWSV